MTPQRLHPDDLAALAALIADHLRGQLPSGPPLKAHEYAKKYNLSRATVYEHAAELGAFKVGNAMRFPDRPPPPVCAPTAEPQQQPPRARSAPPAGDLLPIGGRRGGS